MDAKVQLQIAGNSVTVEGSEQFVKDQIDVLLMNFVLQQARKKFPMHHLSKLHI